jgi:hypothetical protein
MRNKKLIVLIIVWAISIILLETTRPTYLVERDCSVDSLVVFWSFGFPNLLSISASASLAESVDWVEARNPISPTIIFVDDGIKSNSVRNVIVSKIKYYSLYFFIMDSLKRGELTFYYLFTRSRNSG